jgi:hypothetical protein
MCNIEKEVTVDQAKEIAEKNVIKELGNLLAGYENEIFTKKYIEGEYCWMFFINPKISLPIKAQPLIDRSYVVAKNREYRNVANFHHDHERAQKYLTFMSKYFKGEEVNLDALRNLISEIKKEP